MDEPAKSQLDKARENLAMVEADRSSLMVKAQRLRAKAVILEALVPLLDALGDHTTHTIEVIGEGNKLFALNEYYFNVDGNFTAVASANYHHSRRPVSIWSLSPSGRHMQLELKRHFFETDSEYLAAFLTAQAENGERIRQYGDDGERQCDTVLKWALEHSTWRAFSRVAGHFELHRPSTAIVREIMTEVGLNAATEAGISR